MGNYTKKVFLNGKIVPYQEATISVFDRGFIFGDGVYEVMTQINGSFFYKEAHLNRLSECLQKIKINFDTSNIQSHINQLIKVSKLEDQNCLVYIQITRGVAPRKHAYPKEVTPTIMMYALPVVLPNMSQKHMSVISAPDYRWSRCDIKMTSLLGNVMVNEYATQNGAYEAILIREGVVTEASHCNVFFVKNNVVYTHPANTFILNGITRQIVIQLCHKLEIEIKEIAVREEDMYAMDEAFLTGTSTQIVSVKQVDQHYFYKGDTMGPITKRLQEAFLELKHKYNEDQKLI